MHIWIPRTQTNRNRYIHQNVGDPTFSVACSCSGIRQVEMFSIINYHALKLAPSIRICRWNIWLFPIFCPYYTQAEPIPGFIPLWLLMFLNFCHIIVMKHEEHHSFCMYTFSVCFFVQPFLNTFLSSKFSTLSNLSTNFKKKLQLILQVLRASASWLWAHKEFTRDYTVYIILYSCL
jgi:hypothetical protein